MRWFRHHRCDPYRRPHQERGSVGQGVSVPPAVAPADGAVIGVTGAGWVDSTHRTALSAAAPAPAATTLALRGETAVRRNVAVRAGDRMFRVGQLVAPGADDQIDTDVRAHLAVLYRTVQRVLEVHGPNFDGGCAGCCNGSGRRWATSSTSCSTRKLVLRCLSEEDIDER